MRVRGRKDAEHAEIARALVAAGCTVCDTSALGGGFPDLVVGRNGATYLLEVKGLGGSKTPMQVLFFDRWRGGTLCIVTSAIDALRLVGAGRSAKSRSGPREAPLVVPPAEDAAAE